MKKLTPKGMRDYYNEEAILREKIIDKIVKIYRKYGFKPLETPALEYLEILKAKSGEEIAGQIYKIENDDLGLRFDLTVPLARFASNIALPKPFKRYQIAKVWRKEEPQKGRLREFYQADADIIGSKSMRCEAELFALANDVLKSLGFSEHFFILNNRKILNSILERVGINEERSTILRFLDKIEKFGKEKVENEIEKIVGREKKEKLFEIIDLKGDNEEKILEIKKINEEGAKELEEILEYVKEYDEKINIKIDLSLVRGLDYYTGPIFEIKANKDIGSIGGGGRYDNLLEIYGERDFATGISLGIERIFFILSENLKEKTYTKVFVASLDNCYKEAIRIAHYLRKNNIEVETDLNERSLTKQFEYCDAMGIKYLIIVGKKEIEEKRYTLRDMEKREEKKLTLEEILRVIKDGS